LGYSISHAFGAVYDNPHTIALTIVGDGESETGPLATSRHSNKFLNPITDGCVLPVLHLNGYKINNPTILARIQEEELLFLMRGYGWTPYMVAGHDLESMHQAMAATMETCVKEILRYQKEARDSGKAFRPRWPMIILRSPKGWTAPRKNDDGKFLEGYWRAHQVPLTKVATDSEQLKMLERWMHSYEPGKLFGIEGKLISDLRELAPSRGKRMSENPITNGGILRRPLKMRHFQDFSLRVDKPGVTTGLTMSVFANFLREIVKDNQQTFRVFGPDETESNKLGRIYEVGKKVWVNGYLPEDEDGGNLAPEGRVMKMLSEHTVEGWLEGYILSGRHGMLNSYESFVHIIDSMVNQHAKWMEKCTEVSWRRAVFSLNILLTSTASLAL
jgi:xylulose-5-phosphate/fructose-6-phosphate phosphoketolase